MLENVTLHDVADKVSQALVVGFDFLHDAFDFRAVVGGHLSAGRVGEQFVGESAEELGLPACQQRAEFGGTVIGFTGGKFTRRSGLRGQTLNFNILNL